MMREGIHRLLLRLSKFDKPSIASINGAAVAGGLSIALCCDFRIASDKAKLGDGILRFGMMSDAGGPWFLPRIVGLQKAIELILLGEVLDAMEAQRIGLVGKVVPHEELKSITQELAIRLTEAAPIALRMNKNCIYRELDMDLASALEDQGIAGEIVHRTEDAEEGLSAFREKRAPVYKGK
jgi:enoyl-CoA hydratase/carnithine racemase